MIAIVWQESKTRWYWWGLWLLLPAFLFPSGWRSIVVCLLPAFFVIHQYKEGKLLYRTPLDIPILGLAIMVLVSLCVTFDIELSFAKIAGMVLGITLFYGAVAQCQENEWGIWQIVGMVLLVGTGMAVIGIVGSEWTGLFSFLNRAGDILPAQLTRLPGVAGGIINPNELAGVMNWIFPLALALWVGIWTTKEQMQRTNLLIVLGSITILTGFVLIISGSRGGIMAGGISLLVMLAMVSRWGKWLLGIGIIAGIGLLIYFGTGTILDKDVSNSGVQLDTVVGRFALYERAWYGIQDFPWTGMSMNGFRQVVNELYPLSLEPPPNDIGHAHNNLLQVALDLGVPGLLFYIAIWMICIWQLWHSYKQIEQPLLMALLVGVSGALVGGCFFGLLDAIALGARPGFIWWLLLALVAGIQQKTTSKAVTEKG